LMLELVTVANIRGGRIDCRLANLLQKLSGRRYLF
jgi:hypothetical protein